MGSYSRSDSLSENEFNYGVDGCVFEPTRSDDDTAGEFRRAGDFGEAGVVVAWTPTPHSV